MTWLLVIIAAYLILAVVFLVDKYLLTASFPNPKVFAFNVGVLGILALVFAPFVGFEFPSAKQIMLSLASGALFIYGLYWFFKGLHLYEPSRIVPAISGIIPIFTFLLVYIFSGGKETFTIKEFLSFIMLVLGSVLITYQKGKEIYSGIKISALSAFFLALSFVLTKYVFLEQPFVSGYIWMRVGGFLMAGIFFLSKEVRTGLAQTKNNFPKKGAVLFLSNQLAGFGANVLQNWSIALVPLAYVSIINALQGVQYIFMFIFAAILSLKFPKILKEEIFRGILIQKISAILIIIAGLAILAIR